MLKPDYFQWLKKQKETPLSKAKLYLLVTFVLYFTFLHLDSYARVCIHYVIYQVISVYEPDNDLIRRNPPVWNKHNKLQNVSKLFHVVTISLV